MNICLSIPFPSTEFTSLVYDVVSIDKELKRSGVHRTIETDGTILKVTFYGEELKRLRVAVNAFIKNIKLIVKTINQFPSFLN